MLTIKTKLKEFPEKGIGLTADQDIKEGQVIWKYSPLIDITIKKTEIPPEAKGFFDTYGVDRGSDTLFLNTDNARFINHSKDPNIKSIGHLKNNIAIRNIKKGEEITIDYNEIDVTDIDF
ncbi:SET domain-containing protein [Nanoarchaeota archaeon]